MPKGVHNRPSTCQVYTLPSGAGRALKAAITGKGGEWQKRDVKSQGAQQVCTPRRGYKVPSPEETVEQYWSVALVTRKWDLVPAHGCFSHFIHGETEVQSQGLSTVGIDLKFQENPDSKTLALRAATTQLGTLLDSIHRTPSTPSCHKSWPRERAPLPAHSARDCLCPREAGPRQVLPSQPCYCTEVQVTSLRASGISYTTLEAKKVYLEACWPFAVTRWTL
jgi:hypothetical protein